VSKLLNPELFQVFLQWAGQAAQLGQPMGYDIAGMAVYNLKLMGASWVDNFKIPQQEQDQQQMKQAQLQQMAKAPAQGGAPQ
jgi:hypothetical protein